MPRRLVTLILLVLLVSLQAQLWLGRGSLPSVAKLHQQVQEQQNRNAQAQLANEQMQAEIRDLQEGLEIVEEKARSELGMVKSDEIYVQIAR
ncbi:cell division protein FtsB [Curvibacter sp. CHRR-16]|uniref:cell division protein FtsB n=1 Tax=Curvibacter sp. CHRR-16 TaxID=2835872 RepID=UPI001BD95F34|nr:cell division protein FtsB [Curvibacter sp. CHRR-16]MBT0568802.1 cell division protein FtsB [Curvibacter sp. CHRR-16]